MSRFCVSLAACLLIGPLVARTAADDAKAAAELVEKAIQASGGAEKLKKYQALTWKEKGTYYGTGAALPYEGEYSVQYPDKFRMEIVGVLVIVVNGDKGYTSMGGEVKEMDKDDMDEQKKQRHAQLLTTLLPLKDKKLKLALTGETKIENRPAIGLKVTCDGQRDVSLWFDQEKHLLLKMEFVVKSREHDNREVLQEVLFSGYKDVDGLQQPTKLVVKRDGSPFVDSELSEFKLFEKLDESVFAKP